MSWLLMLLLAVGLAAGHRSAAAQPTPAASATPATAPEPRFAVLEFVVEGNTTLPGIVIEGAVLPFLGPQGSMARVEQARAALERAYQSAGFLSVFVDIPEQRVDEGVVQLRVVEGRVERLAVTGARYYDQGVIRRQVPELAAGNVPNFNRVQAQLAAVARDERQLQPVLRPGTLPGTVEAELKVQDKLPLAAQVELNNQHAANTDLWRLNATLRYSNLWQRDHALALTLVTAPREPAQSTVLVANYTLPLAPDWTGVVYAVVSDSLVEPVGASVVGQGFTLGLRALRSFGWGASSHSLSFGADFKDLKERLTFGDDSLSTPLRYLPFQLAYTGTWPEGRTLSTLNLQWTTAFRSLLQRDVECPGSIGPVDQFACKRAGGDGGFTHLRAELRHQRPMPFALPGQLALRLQGQGGSQPLVSAEQLAVGGADTVRGYLEAEASGDRGLQGSLEWRSPGLLSRETAERLGLEDLSLLAFVDVARVWVLQPSVGQAPRVSLYGGGLGLRLRAAPGLSAEADIAFPSKRTTSTPDHDPRLHLALRAQF
ncbi:MAG: ShlB/FhaC/HecB family hemolysin secretion/activation protein [Rubrivivax sp.]|nr:ShlB/FhaC/HecB family hemolysin secretion/activation protein [Rubrivivax sp.]